MVKCSTVYFYDDFEIYLEVLMEKNESVLDGNQLHEDIICDCLSNIIEQVAHLASLSDIAMIDPTKNQNKNGKIHGYYIIYFITLNYSLNGRHFNKIYNIE